MQKIRPLEIPIHRGTMYKSPEERQREYDRHKEIALKFLLFGDGIEGLEIQLFGPEAGVEDALSSVDKINRDAKKIAEHLHVEHQEAVDFIRSIAGTKRLQKLIKQSKSSQASGRHFG